MMHSSLINKISILRPRKKAENSSQKKPDTSSAQTFTITNTNCHSSLTPKDVPTTSSDDQPPPLIPKSSASTEVANSTSSHWVPVYIVDVANSAKDSEGKTLSLQKIAPKGGKNASDEHPVSGSDKKSISCFICPSKFSTVQDMQDHYLESHKKMKRLQPKKIGKDSSETSAIPTVETVEEGEPKCPICSIGFKTKEEVQEHMGSVHCYDCSECNNTFYTLFQFTDHKCVKVIRPKRQKLKKKKATVEKDPLAIAPTEAQHISSINSLKGTDVSKTFAITVAPNILVPSNKSAYPIVLPFTGQLSSNKGTCPTVTSNLKQNDPLQVRTIYNSPLPSVGSHWNHENSKKLDAEILSYSFEELTSKEVVEKKLKEILCNPSISLKRLSKDNVDSSTEYFSCGRCNVLCEDHSDYLDHLEECLRLSNVSILPSSGSAKRFLNLRSELVSSKKFYYHNASGINKSLMNELRNFVEAPDLLESLEKNENHISLSKDSPENSRMDENDDCVKLNESVSIKKIARSNKSVLGTHNNGNSLLLHSSEPQYKPISQNGKQPMVIIPINREFASLPNHTDTTQINKDDYEEHYPDISITDKNNSVVYKFADRTKMEKFLDVDTPQISLGMSNHNKVTNAILLRPRNTDNNPLQIQTRRILIPLQKALNSSIVSTSIQSEESEPTDSLCNSPIDIKEEPLSPNSNMEENNDLNGNLEEDNSAWSKSPMELVLDDEDIKMEIEDEVLDDKF